MPTVSITWHTQHDDRVCPVCNAIDGYTWTFEGDVPDSLIHPEHGEVWNTVLGSLAHEVHQFGNKHGLFSTCRCHIEPKVDARDLIYLLQRKIDELKGEFKEVDDTKGGNSRGTSFGDLGIDPSKYGFE